MTHTDSNDANIRFHDVDTLGNGVIASTQVYEITDYVSATGNCDWPTVLIFFSRNSSSSKDISNTAHEIGHALGLAHVKSRPVSGYSLMHPTQPLVTITNDYVDNIHHRY